MILLPGKTPRQRLISSLQVIRGVAAQAGVGYIELHKEQYEELIDSANLLLQEFSEMESDMSDLRVMYAASEARVSEVSEELVVANSAIEELEVKLSETEAEINSLVDDKDEADETSD